MSLLSPEQIVVALAPERIGAQRLGGWRGKKLLDQHAATLRPDGGMPWVAPIEALELLLDDKAWGNRDLTVVLSSHFVRYAVLPPGAQLRPAEQEGVARVIFRKLFGELAADWTLRASPVPRQPGVACGIPRPLLELLRKVCEGRARLKSIQPMLMAVYNAARPVMARGEGTLALVEAGRLTLASLTGGQWHAVASRAADPENLPALLDESAGLGGHGGGVLWLCDPGGQAVVPESPPWQVERLPARTAWGLA